MLVLVTFGCASVQQPTGGPKDRQPPKIIRETPKNLALNFSAKKIEIEFDEFIKLTNEFKEISISPSVDRFPLFKVKKNVLHISFQDTLEKNTTYTINFGKAIVDYNEGNVLKNYSYVFSTGSVIDSLSISGNVVQSLTKKPEIEISVLLIPVRQDSIFGKRPANIYAVTDSLGNFSLKNLRPDTYRIYALKEPAADRVYNSLTEEIGFVADSIVLSKNISGIRLETFKEEPPVFNTLERKIGSDGRIFFTFNQQSLNPSLRILSPAELDTDKIVEFTARGDTASMWLPEMTFDSLSVEVRSNSLPKDTVVLRRAKRDTYNKVLVVRDNAGTHSITPQTGLFITFSSPLTSFDQSKITLFDDTTAIKGFRIVKDSTSIRTYKLDYPWRIGHSYTYRLGDNAFSGPFGANKYFTNTFKLREEDVYANMILSATTSGTGNFIVQLLKDGTQVVKSNTITGSTKIAYRNLPAGKYSIRVLYDENNNGKWDTGNVRQRKQPEKVWNSDKILTLRPNWDTDETISIPGL